MKTNAFLASAMLAVMLSAAPAFAQEAAFGDTRPAKAQPSEPDAGDYNPMGGGDAPFGESDTAVPSAAPSGGRPFKDPVGGSNSARARTPFGGGSRFGTPMPMGDFQRQPEKWLHMLELKTGEADAIADMLKQMYRDQIAVTAFPKENRIAIYGTPDQIEEAKKLVAQLDEKNEMQDDTGMMPGMGTSGYPSPPGDVAKLKQQYAASEKRSLELAAKYREESKQRKTDDPRLQKIHQQLQEAVTRAFQHRQDLHRAEIAQLDQKIKKMKDLLSARDRIKSEIIDRRVSDLKNPARRWEDGQERSSSDPDRPGTSQASPSRRPGGLGPGRSRFGSRPSRPTVERKPATITAVSEKHQLVEISVGPTDRFFFPNRKLFVWRGNTYLGEVEIIYVRGDQCVARILKSQHDAPFQKGDHVGIVLPKGIEWSAEESTSTEATQPEAVQIHFTKPESATILWTTEDGATSQAVMLPGRIDIPKTKVVMFQLENVPGHPNQMFFGAFTSYVKTPAAELFAKHNAVPVEFTNEDIDQASSNNLLTKVLYLPKTGSNESSTGGNVETLVSTKLDPGVDPLQEAEKRGDVLGILRLGNRESRIGENEDWRQKFLQNRLEAIEAERDQVKEELLIYEETLLEEADITAEARAQLTEKIATLKNQLANIELRRELYLNEVAEDDEKNEVEP